MSKEIENIVDKYLGMLPRDVGCKSWNIMRINMIEEFKSISAPADIVFESVDRTVSIKPIDNSIGYNRNTKIIDLKEHKEWKPLYTSISKIYMRNAYSQKGFNEFTLLKLSKIERKSVLNTPFIGKVKYTQISNLLQSVGICFKGDENNVPLKPLFYGSELLSMPNGIYQIRWNNEEGESIASVGRLHNGDIWIAPTNWKNKTNPIAIISNIVSQIDNMVLLYKTNNK